MSIAESLREIQERIREACIAAGRDPAEVTLVAVSKLHPPAAIDEARRAGQVDFGENYVQEVREKVPVLPDTIKWHYIGSLQRNKVKYLAPWVHMIHTVDSLRLAQEIDHRAAEHGRVIPVLLQVNVAREGVKSGCAPEEARGLAEQIARLEHLELRGLMTMPPFWPAERVRPFFAGLRELRDRLRVDLGLALPELSMGMTADFEVAIAEGATLVRIGTAIFGSRN
ncbi:MAG TPA: YggS family pyridoxal phosphate-dependent enzyme [bacterium]|nr:YggS family pyridoxal phosphate-dependent enzyme [bacterium]